MFSQMTVELLKAYIFNEIKFSMMDYSRFLEFHTLGGKNLFIKSSQMWFIDRLILEQGHL